MVPNPNHIYNYQTTNSTLIEIFEAFSQQGQFNKDFKRRKSEFEIRVPGSPLLGERGPVIPNKYWSIQGGWSYTLSKMDLDLAYFDDWFLEKIPQGYAEGLLKKGWPSKGILRQGLKGTLEVMTTLEYFDAFSLRVAGELRGLFWLCLLYYEPLSSTGTTVECQQGGSVWTKPHIFLTKTMPDAVLHGKRYLPSRNPPAPAPAPKPSPKQNRTLPAPAPSFCPV
jgi:hypothetical protein